MSLDVGPASLRHEELVTLVQQLRQQLAERDRQIAHLQHLVAEGRAPSAPKESGQQAGSPVPEEPSLGSQEDLLAQLEKVYPES